MRTSGRLGIQGFFFFPSEEEAGEFQSLRQATPALGTQGPVLLGIGEVWGAGSQAGLLQIPGANLQRKWSLAITGQRTANTFDNCHLM